MENEKLVFMEYMVSDVCPYSSRSRNGGTTIDEKESSETWSNSNLPLRSRPLNNYERGFAMGVEHGFKQETTSVESKTAAFQAGYNDGFQQGFSLFGASRSRKGGAQDSDNDDNQYKASIHTQEQDLSALLQFIKHVTPERSFSKLNTQTAIACFTLLTASTPNSAQTCGVSFAPLCRLLWNNNELRDVATKPLIRPSFQTGPSSIESVEVLDSVGKCYINPESMRSQVPKIDSKQSVCVRLRSTLADSKVRLRIHNLFTLLPERWLDSVCIDCYLHVLQRHFPRRSELFIISAEVDPDFDLLIQTTHCYNYLLLPLFLRQHWSLIFVNRECKEIHYFNSDLRDPFNSEEQVAPFRKHFRGFKIDVVRTPLQSDHFSCGTFVAYYSYCLLFSPQSLANLHGFHAESFRNTILKQICVSFLS